MKERPILFSGPMVRAILKGRKTQTRRVMNPQPEHAQIYTWRGKVIRDAEHRMWCRKKLVLENIWDFPNGEDRKTLAAACPHGDAGDRLWVKEGVITHASIEQLVGYLADGCKRTEAWEKLRTGIHMPRWASRITLEISAVRVQRLQEISEDDAKAEGVRMPDGIGEAPDFWSYAKEFGYLWDEINAKRGFGWGTNPWVWAITFRRVA